MFDGPETFGRPVFVCLQVGILLRLSESLVECIIFVRDCLHYYFVFPYFDCFVHFKLTKYLDLHQGQYKFLPPALLNLFQNTYKCFLQFLLQTCKIYESHLSFVLIGKTNICHMTDKYKDYAEICQTFVILFACMDLHQLYKQQIKDRRKYLVKYQPVIFGRHIIKKIPDVYKSAS